MSATALLVLSAFLACAVEAVEALTIVVDGALGRPHGRAGGHANDAPQRVAAGS